MISVLKKFSSWLRIVQLVSEHVKHNLTSTICVSQVLESTSLTTRCSGWCPGPLSVRQNLSVLVYLPIAEVLELSEYLHYAEREPPYQALS